MKKLIIFWVGACLLCFTFEACKKEVKETADASEPITEETLAKISSLGFGTQNVQKIAEGYLVEGDIILHEEDLNSHSSSPSLLVAQEEQYRTFNLVTGLPRTIKVDVSSTDLTGAVDEAIRRYNALGLQLKFQRSSSSPDIVIRSVSNVSYIASAGFPKGGKPYGQIKYNSVYAGSNYTTGFKASVIAHEMGHCIGFRHTDYMNRSYSCGGSGGNEGAGSVGAVHIPGTPTGPDPNSWMLACIGAKDDRPFNANDKVALNYLY